MKIFGLLITCLILALSCKTQEKHLVDAQIIDTGMIAADGCGWLVKANGISYSPVNLDSSFMVNDLAVMISFEENGDSLSCGLLPNFHPLIHIDAIERK